MNAGIFFIVFVVVCVLSFVLGYVIECNKYNNRDDNERLQDFNEDSRGRV